MNELISIIYLIACAILGYYIGLTGYSREWSLVMAMGIYTIIHLLTLTPLYFIARALVGGS